jgi:Mg/Co/Ni transporter MgtE
MQPVSTLLETAGYRIVASQTASREGAFVLNADNRVMGVLDAQALLEVSAGSHPHSLCSTGFVTVQANSKLIDASRLAKMGQPVAVVDEGGAFIGTLEAENILECISAVSSPRNLSAEGAHHA